MFGEISFSSVDHSPLMPPARQRHPLLGTTIVFFVLALAGCVGSPEPQTASDTPMEAAPSAPTPPDSATRTPKAEQAHVHDYWDGETSAVLLDEKVPVMVFHNHLLDEPPREQHTHGCDETLASDSQGGSRKFSLPPGKIVLPGTATLDFMFGWNDPTVTGLRLIYRPANAHDFVDGGLVENGKAMQVALTPAMADAGHTTRTKWAFFLCASSSAPLAFAQGDISSNILALRAVELPADPPHPDAWNGATSIRIAELERSVEAIAALNKGQDAWVQVPHEHGSIVPVGTEAVTVNVTLQATGPAESLDPSAVMVYYRDASVPEWVYTTANLSSSEGGLLSYGIPVDHDQVDGVYAEESSWDIWIRILGSTHQTTSAGTLSSPHQFSGRLSVVVEAHRIVVEDS